ncbi:MAG: (Fe-S)-binding protein [Gammaproteobacteria bacterium]|nr:(Fe-S)-binding protein [Gammaproteobacteria bacterium]
MDREALLIEADRCVKCGLCLPHCPTYLSTRDEGDSPRGRIALIQGYVQQRVDTPRLHRHLDRCLGCLACERACPSGVEYGRLIDAVRALQPHARRPNSRLRLELISRLPYMKAMPALLDFYQRSGLRSLAKKVGGHKFRRLDALLPRTTTRSPLQTTPTSGVTGRVALFTGCVGNIADRPALLALQRLLDRLGFEVVVPREQVCCGALHQHNGQPAKARQLAARNRALFDADPVEAILFVASGCGAQLLDYPRLDAALEAPVIEACRFLLRQPGVAALPFAPLEANVLLHTPCSARQLPGGGEAVAELLGLIPGIAVQRAASSHCCGAAGSYLLTQPELADQLREPLVAAAGRAQFDALLTSNTGCALHLAAGLHGEGSTLRVMHPLELLHAQLKE